MVPGWMLIPTRAWSRRFSVTRVPLDPPNPPPRPDPRWPWSGGPYSIPALWLALCSSLI